MRGGDRRDTGVYDGEGGAWTEFFKLPLNVRKNRGVFLSIRVVIIWEGGKKE